MARHFFGTWLALPIASVVLAAAPQAAAYCRTTTCAAAGAQANCTRDPVTGCHAFGAPLFWQQSCVSYSIFVRGSPKLGLDYEQSEALVASAFAAWPTVACASGFPSIAVTSFGATSCDKVEFNGGGPNANAVIFRDLEWPHALTQLALTTVSFDRNTGKIHGADVEINTFGYPLTPAQAQFILTHEAGHFLGLDHSFDGSAVMTASYDFFAEPVLAPDDVAAICAAYPPERPQTECNAEPEDGYAADCGGNVEGGCTTVTRPVTFGAAAAALCAAAAAVALSRRRLRRSERV